MTFPSSNSAPEAIIDSVSSPLEAESGASTAPMKKLTVITRVSIKLKSQPGWPVSGFRDEFGTVRVGYFGSSSARVVREDEILSIVDRVPDPVGA